VGSIEGAGVVQVLYGRAGDLWEVEDDWFDQTTWGMADDGEESDGFGRSLAAVCHSGRPQSVPARDAAGDVGGRCRRVETLAS
jgi:hypothetical protein